MDKKNSNRFSIVFDPDNEQELRAMNILNSLPARKKARYIAQAIVKFERGTKLVPNNSMEKRRRGRPPKKQQSVPEIPVITGELVEVSDSSSSHTLKNNKDTAQTPIMVSSAMVDSMLSFVQKQ